MAGTVWTTAFLKIATVDFTSRCRGITLNYGAEMVEDTVFGATARTKTPGYKNWSFDVELLTNYGANSVEAVLYPLVGNATAFEVEVRPDSAAQSANNPTYKGNCVLATFNPMGGKVGDLMVTPVHLEGAGTLTRNAT